MSEPTHGTRRCYQRGCRDARCTDANTRYMASYRAAYRRGRPPLGIHVAGAEAARILQALREEGFLRAEIATWLGYRWPTTPLPQPAGVTLRTVLRLRVIQRRLCE